MRMIHKILLSDNVAATHGLNLYRARPRLPRKRPMDDGEPGARSPISLNHEAENDTESEGSINLYDIDTVGKLPWFCQMICGDCITIPGYKDPKTGQDMTYEEFVKQHPDRVKGCRGRRKKSSF